MKMIPYLLFAGNCREAFEFYARLLGGQIVFQMTFGDSPEKNTDCANSLPADKIMHACLEFQGQRLMGSDCPPQFQQKPAGFNVNLSVETEAEAERLFAALAKDGNVSMPIGETFWARRFGMCTDRFGTPWMINCEKPVPVHA